MKSLKEIFGFGSKKRTYLSSSEFVSSGHPDRLCDNLAAIIIDDIQKKDGCKSHAAVEVFLTYNTVVFGGEVTTSLDIDIPYLKKVLRKGFNMSGYIPEMRKFWTKSECVLPGNLRIINKIKYQSPDIAIGTTDKGEDSGWNDQGVYFSSSEYTNKFRLGTAHMIAQLISEDLHSLSRQSILESGETTDGHIIGPDNKCVVTVKVGDDGFTPIEVTAITIAISHSSASEVSNLREFIKRKVLTLLNRARIKVSSDIKWVINGTGRFVIHGVMSDTSLTGRKISVNHPSAGPVWSNKMIGGGALCKPAHASDLILNVTSRFIANVIVTSGLSSYAIVGCSGSIGTKGIQSLFIKGDEKFENSKVRAKVQEFFEKTIDWSPIAIANWFGFFNKDFNFAEIVNYNFFGHGSIQPWDNQELINKKVKELKAYI